MSTVSLINEDSKHIDALMKKNCPLDDEIVFTSVELTNSKQTGYSSIYRNAAAVDGLISNPHPSLTTLYELFEQAVSNFPQKDSLGFRTRLSDGQAGPYVFENYATTKERRDNLGSGIFFILQNNPFRLDIPAHNKIKYDQAASESPFVLSIFSANRPEWVITDCACVAYSITSTALYESLGSESTEYILNLTESPIVVCSKDKIEMLINIKKKFPQELKTLIALVSMDQFTEQDSHLVEFGKQHQIAVYDFIQVESLGKINRLPLIKPTPETVYTISFTSGTTGAHPKGVVLTNRNAVSSITFCCSLQAALDCPTVYSFLPLAHIYERMSLQFALFRGSQIGFPQSASPLTLLDDIKALRPHFLALVPRVFTKLEAGLKAQTINNYDSPTLQKLFTRAINKKIELQGAHDGSPGTHIVYDRLIDLLRKKIGFDRLIGVSTGSAPIAPETIKFLKASCNIGMSQGYGLTESFAGICSSPKYEANPGSCGAIAVTTEMRLREIPSMNYYADDPEGPKGELLVRGPQIFSHYYKNPEETAKAIDSDGWFATGDVARIDPKNKNRLYIIDRVKNFFKLAQGEYITPERIENLYLACFPALQQIYVHGDSLQTYLVGIVGLDESTAPILMNKLFQENITDKDKILNFFEDVKNRKKLLSFMNKSVVGKLNGFERIHNIKVSFNPLRIEDDVITPTMKIKRPLAFKHYKDVFTSLYEEGSILDKVEAPKL